MSATILEVDDVSVAFDGFTVLNHMTFKMNYGEVRFLIGPNGAGKTTMLDVITGKTRPDGGKVLFDGVPTGGSREHTLARRGIGRKFQTPAIFPSLTIAENVITALGAHESVWGLFRTLKPAQRQQLEASLEAVGMADRPTRLAGTLSHGEKQWLEIAMLLAQAPKLLLLDEPVAGMTRRERDRTGELLHAISKDRAVLVVEHDMEFVRQYAQIVTVLHAGSVLCEGPMEQVQNDERVVEVYLGRGKVHR